MKKLLKRLSSRLFITAIIILIQFAWIAYTLYEASEVNPFFAWSIRIASVVFALYVVYLLVIHILLHCTLMMVQTILRKQQEQHTVLHLDCLYL